MEVDFCRKKQLERSAFSLVAHKPKLASSGVDGHCGGNRTTCADPGGLQICHLNLVSGVECKSYNPNDRHFIEK